MRLLLAAFLLAASANLAGAQFKEEDLGAGVRYGETRTHRYQAGVVVTAVGGSCKGMIATVPVPFDWPEQEVKIVNEEISPTVKEVGYRMIDGTVKQMLIEIPILAAGQEAKAVITFEVTRRDILPPPDTSALSIPKRPDRDAKRYLADSPLIETRNARIRELSRELTSEPETAWEKAEAIYDHVRKAIKYKEGPIKGAVKGLRDGEGDCEDMTSLFIALCRAADIPARSVWIPGHCYPEFYLVDQDGKGYWFPCQAAGTRAFGAMSEARPVLQKGDSFKVPEKPKEKQRYVAEFLKGVPSGDGGKPKVKFIRKLVE